MAYKSKKSYKGSQDLTNFLFFGNPFLHNSEAFMNWSLKSTTILYKSPNFRQSGGYLQILYSIFLLVSKWFLPPRNGLKYKYSKKTTLDLQRQILYYTNKRASHWICSCIISSSASINLLQQLLLQKKLANDDSYIERAKVRRGAVMFWFKSS